MIASISHKGLRLFWKKNNPSKLPAAHIGRIRLVLTQLHSAKKVEDMDFPGSGLHPLKGDLEGYWSVRVSGNYRIIFRFEEENAHDVEYIDYH